MILVVCRARFLAIVLGSVKLGVCCSVACGQWSGCVSLLSRNAQQYQWLLHNARIWIAAGHLRTGSTDGCLAATREGYMVGVPDRARKVHFWFVHIRVVPGTFSVVRKGHGSQELEVTVQWSIFGRCRKDVLPLKLAGLCLP